MITSQERFIVKDTRNGKYRVKSIGFSSSKWTDDMNKAFLFKTAAAAKKGMYSYNINPERGRIGAKIILPDWVKIMPVKIELTIETELATEKE